MTKKFICPNCKNKLEYIKEYAFECNFVTYVISNTSNEVIIDKINRNRPATFYECNKCGYHGTDTVREFVVEEEET